MLPQISCFSEFLIEIPRAYSLYQLDEKSRDIDFALKNFQNFG